VTTYAVVVAAGRGERFGADTPKQFVPLGGRPLLAWSVATLAASPVVDRLVVVTAPEHLGIATALAGPEPKVSAVVAGGSERADSVRAALDALVSATDDDLVLIHDGARPLVRAAVVDACVARLQGGAEAVAVAVASTDTMLLVDGGFVVGVPDRASLWRAQTPQGFRLGVLRRAHAAAAADPEHAPTDDCGVVLRYCPDVVIAVVAGEEANLKITTPTDLALAEAVVSRRGDG
jgi:2-C-methyl-D-erythritol 4-phosphate cytidylyltransferase